jgi:hypothetical protein
MDGAIELLEELYVLSSTTRTIPWTIIYPSKGPSILTPPLQM